MRRCVRSPEDGDEGGVDGVAVVDVHVVPAALGGEVVEAQPQHRVRTETQGAETWEHREHREHITRLHFSGSSLEEGLGVFRTSDSAQNWEVPAFKCNICALKKASQDLFCLHTSGGAGLFVFRRSFLKLVGI